MTAFGSRTFHELVAIFIAKMGDIQACKRIGGLHQQFFAERHGAHALARSQYRERTFQPSKVEETLRLRRHLDAQIFQKGRLLAEDTGGAA